MCGVVLRVERRVTGQLVGVQVVRTERICFPDQQCPAHVHVVQLVLWV
jgi:hypothetical protein